MFASKGICLLCGGGSSVSALTSLIRRRPVSLLKVSTSCLHSRITGDFSKRAWGPGQFEKKSSIFTPKKWPCFRKNHTIFLCFPYILYQVRLYVISTNHLSTAFLSDNIRRVSINHALLKYFCQYAGKPIKISSEQNILNNILSNMLLKS